MKKKIKNKTQMTFHFYNNTLKENSAMWLKTVGFLFKKI